MYRGLTALQEIALRHEGKIKGEPKSNKTHLLSMIPILSGSANGRARKRETVASGIETARPKIDASSEPQRPIGKIYAAEQHEQTPTDRLRSPLKSISEKSPAQTSSQKEAARKKRWQQKNKKKLAAYQKKWRARNK